MTSTGDMQQGEINEEATRFLSPPPTEQCGKADTKSDAWKAKQMNRLMSLFILCAFAFILSTLVLRDNPINGIRSTGQPPPDGRDYPQYSCPADVHEALNAVGAGFEEAYASVSEHIIESNVTKFIETFRNEEFDEWGKTYNKIKAGMRDWKVNHYANNLKDGDSIYESAMGIGLNSFLTLEAVQEVKELRDIKVYGNDYVAESAYLASKLLPNLLPQVNASLGTVCHGDSSFLRSFVPAESFDLVFCGYTSTLINPLNFEDNFEDEMYEYICNSTEEDWEAKKLSEIAQERQDAWFANWVSEMIRIAKPGAAVIVEQVSLPLCDDPEDWGGVLPEFWTKGVDTYGWDIDPSSIDMEHDKIFGGKFGEIGRYHVFMKKNA